MEGTGLTEIIQQVRDQESRGAYFRAADLADRILSGNIAGAGEEELHQLRYLHTRIVARSGATQQARKLYDEYCLGEKSDDRDALTLDARIMKDRALKARAERRPDRLREAARRYQDIFEQRPDSYPAVNAATLYFLAGMADEADHLATEALLCCSNETPKGEWEEYFHAATIAEAALLHGDPQTAEEQIRRAASIDAVDDAETAETDLRSQAFRS